MVGTYKPNPGSSSCTNCPDGSETANVPQGSVSIVECVCGPDFDGPNGGPCEPKELIKCDPGYTGPDGGILVSSSRSWHRGKRTRHILQHIVKVCVRVNRPLQAMCCGHIQGDHGQLGMHTMPRAFNFRRWLHRMLLFERLVGRTFQSVPFS